jgi:hypothetical protein
MQRMTRATAIMSIASFAALSVTLAGATAPAWADVSPMGHSVQPLAVKFTDGRPGQVTSKTVSGKTVYYLSINGAPATPGVYACADGKHINVSGPGGLIDPVRSTVMLNPQPLPP